MNEYNEKYQIEATKKNPEDFRPIYEHYYPAIFRFINRRTSDEHITADICSQVFLKALSNIGKYEDRGFPFSSWLYRIASNEVNMYYRNLKKKRTVSLDYSGIDLIFEELEQSDIKDKLEKLKRVLQSLPQNAVQLIELRFFEKRPFKEIGEILGITENNAKVKTYRLLDSLKKEMTVVRER